MSVQQYGLTNLGRAAKTDESHCYQLTPGLMNNVIMTDANILEGLLNRRPLKKIARVVLPEADDERVLSAASQLASRHPICPVLLGQPEKLLQRAAALDLDLSGCEIVDPRKDKRIPVLAKLYCAARPRLSVSAAIRMLRKPLYFGSMLVRSGDADTLLAGAVYPSARVIVAALRCIGLASGVSTPSSFFLMLLPEAENPDHRILLFADCAVNVNPSAEQLADIAVSSAMSYGQIVGADPRIAMLSFSTLGSAKHARVERVRQAVAQVRTTHPSLIIDGELQADTALSRTVAKTKVPGAGQVAGRANVLVFPNLDAANIGYKLTQHLAGARAIGPILQGFDRPISDLSRGANTDDIVTTARVLLTQI